MKGIKNEYKCDSCKVDLEIAEVKCYCPKCFRQMTWQHLVSCVDCYKITRQTNAGYACFCDKHKPTMITGMTEQEYAREYPSVNIDQMKKEANVQFAPPKTQLVENKIKLKRYERNRIRLTNETAGNKINTK